MVGWKRLVDSTRPIAAMYANPALRRLQLAGIGSMLGTWAYTVALAVYAYRADGADAVGLLYFVRWTLGAASAPWFSLLADRISRRRVMLASDLARAAMAGGMAAVVVVHGPALLVYALAVLLSVVSSAFHPAQAALLPSLAATPAELSASNAAMSTVSSAGMFVGPALGGLLLTVSGTSAVFAATAGALLWSAACLSGIEPDRVDRGHVEDENVLEELAAGARAAVAGPGLRVVMGLTAAQTIVVGGIDALVVVVAIRVIHAGNGGVGWLTAALGVGGVVGGLVVAALAGRERLAGNFGVGVLLCGAPLALIPVWPNAGFALLVYVLLGLGNTVADVSAMTLLQRTADPQALARVFGILESLILGTLALGALIAPFVVSAVGAKAALVALGLVLPAVLVPLWPRLRAVDAAARAPTEALDVLRSISIFASLPAPALERLAANAVETTVPAGTVVVEQGKPGDRFYAVVAGTAAVDVDGEERTALGPGDFFGEIALIRDVPRTATVRAVGELTLLALDRDPFIATVSGHSPARAAAEAAVAERLHALSA